MIKKCVECPLTAVNQFQYFQNLETLARMVTEASNAKATLQRKSRLTSRCTVADVPLAENMLF